MSTRLLCSRGHHWDSPQGDTPCPVCGSAPVPPEFAETLPPTALRVPPNEAPTLAPGEVPATGGPALPPSLANHPRYRILEQLGVGGMGAVWKAEHQLMEREVALKVINRELTGDSAAIKRFHREVKAVARLNHPNIVTAFDADSVDDTHFLVMEYVKGQSLAKVVADRGPLTVAMACDCIRQAALGLQHAHELGHIHRDIKPQNLMLTPEGQVKVLDFGLARLATETRAEAPSEISAPSKLGGEHSLAGFLTQAGVVMGTPDYIAPEQVSDPRSADIRADIYSLGCTFYHLLTGRVPFGGGSVLDKLMAHQEQTPVPVTELRGDVPGEVVRVLDRMLAKRPEDRYQTPAEVVRDLSQLTQRGILKTTTRPSGSRPAPSVLPATAQVTPVRTVVDRPVVQPVSQPEKRRGWGGLLGCLIVGLILIVAGVGGLILAIQIGIAKVTDAVHDISKLVNEERDNDQLWWLIDEDWQAPPAMTPVDQLFPARLDTFSRGPIRPVENVEELGISKPGHMARYDSFGKTVDVYLFTIPKAEQEQVVSAIQEEAKTAVGGGQVSRSSSNGSSRRLNFARGLPVKERVVVWSRDDRLFAAIGMDTENPDPVLIGLLRAISKRPALKPGDQSSSPQDKAQPKPIH